VCGGSLSSSTTDLVQRQTSTYSNTGHRASAHALPNKYANRARERAAPTTRRGTTSQLVRSAFQSIMGSYEGAFSAEPAARDHPRGGWGGTGSRWLGPRPTRSCQNLVMLWKTSPLRSRVRAGARLEVVGVGAGPHAPPAGAGSQLGPNRSPGGLVGARVRCGGGPGAGGAAASQGRACSTVSATHFALHTSHSTLHLQHPLWPALHSVSTQLATGAVVVVFDVAPTAPRRDIAPLKQVAALVLEGLALVSVAVGRRSSSVSMGR
jgi:hypothetical protein